MAKTSRDPGQQVGARHEHTPIASAIGATPTMTVRSAAAETTVAVTPTGPMESGRSAFEPDMDEDGSETEEVELAGSADMATSML